MKNKILRFLDQVIYWSIIAFPFFMGVAPAPMNAFMGFIIAGFLLKKAIKREKLFNDTPVNLPLLIFFLITVISIVHSVDLKDTIKGGILRLLQFIAVFFVVAQEVKDKKHILRIILSIGAGLLFVSIDSFWQVGFGRDFVRGYEPVINIGLKRATASFKDSNILGVYLSALAPLIFGATLFYSKGAKKIGLSVLSAIVLGGILLTYSRPTLLAIYIVFWFFAIARKNKALTVILILLTLASPFLLPKSVKDWAKEVEYNPLRFMCNDDRVAFYQHSLNMIKAHPVIGLGANTYMKNYKYYKNYPEYKGVVTIDTVYAHNNFLHMAAELGLTGFAVFIWFLIRMFKEAATIQRKLKDNFLSIAALSIIACLIAFLVNGLTESSLYYSRVAAVFWYLIGLIFAFKKIAYADR
jgi:putative inorganic carbon (HCO3(-)) transporter